MFSSKLESCVIRACALSGVLLGSCTILKAQNNFTSINIQSESDGKLIQASGVNGGYLYNCSGKNFWGNCNKAEDVVIDKSSQTEQNFSTWGLNYAMNSDFPNQNKLTIKLGEGDFIFGGSGIDSQGNVTGGVANYIGAYSGSTQKYFTEFKVEGIKNLYLGGTIEIGGHYMGGSVYGGGGARVTFNASGDIISNADIRIMRGTTLGYQQGASILTLTGNSFTSNGIITLGYTPTFAYTSTYGVLDISGVKNATIKELVVSGTDGHVESEYTANTIKAQNLELGTIKVQWNQANLDIKMSAPTDSTTKKDVKIGLLQNSTTNNLNSGSSYTLVLKGDERNLNIGELKHFNAAGGKTSSVINEGGNINIDKVTFNEDGILGSPSVINIESKKGDVILKDVSGCNSGCTGGLGIRPFNTLKVSGNNFYGGIIQAIGLVTAGSNSTLDLTGVTGTKFIDDFQIRSGTLMAKDFHINNFSVYKGNSYSTIKTHIGKSFINYLSMEIGTSNTADGADIRFEGGGDIMNFNLIDARPTSFIRMSAVTNTNANIMNIKEAQVELKNGIFNTIVSTKGQTIITNGASTITANALNINTLLHLKDSSKHGGVTSITLTGREEVKQEFDKYLDVGIDSKDLKNMSGTEIKSLLDSLKDKINTDNQNASGTYVTTSDGKHYLILPDIMSNENITNNSSQALNGGNMLIEQTALTKGALNNYGKILIDKGFVEGNTPTLSITGNLNNYNEIDIGANGHIAVTGNFSNKGKMTFRIQANPNNASDTLVKNGSIKISGSTTFDISPGNSGAFKADIADAKTLASLGQGANSGKQYDLVTAGSINYTYTNGDYTTTFGKNNGTTTIKTEHANGGNCTNTDCQTTDSNGGTKQETEFTTNGKENPWDMDKANTDSNGNLVENGVGEYDNEGNLIQKPSQSDKDTICNASGYCGFGKDENATEADRGYDYAQQKMKNSFALTYKGGNIDGKYIKVEKIVKDTTIGFKIEKVDINGFIEGNTETPLCNADSSTFDCALYMEAGGNNSWINAIKKESANSYEILKKLFYDESSSLVFLVNLDQSLAASRNLAYFLEVGRTLDTAFQHVSNLENKASTLHTLSFAMESARVNRLAKIASVHGSTNEWLAMQNYQRNLEFAHKEAEKLRFASSDDDSVNEVWFDTLADIILRFQQREEYPNHAWINMLGNLNFSSTGSAQLYGFNAGYDYFVSELQTAFGGYGGYGYGIFNGSNNGFTSNTSNNIFAGIYTRTFIENHEIDVTLNTTFGFVNEKQQSQINNFDLLALFHDSYTYTLANMDLNATYGYAFLLKKGYIVKPFAGLSYYVLGSTHFNRGKGDSTTLFALNTQDNARQTLAVNLGIDGRKYFANQSYVFLMGQIKQDVILLQNNLDSNGYVSTEVGDLTSNFNMSYKANGYRSYVFLTGGGEYSFGRWYLNGSLSVQSSIFDKNFGIGMNLGGRIVF